MSMDTDRNLKIELLKILPERTNFFKIHFFHGENLLVGLCWWLKSRCNISNIFLAN